MRDLHVIVLGCLLFFVLITVNGIAMALLINVVVSAFLLLFSCISLTTTMAFYFSFNAYMYIAYDSTSATSLLESTANPTQ